MTEIVPRLVTEGTSKIVLVLIDGLGGVRTDERGSELHAATTPNMDRLAREGSSGLHTVIAPGVTSASGVIADRRTGRLPTDENARLCVKILAGLTPPAGVEVFLETEREHRALLVLRGEGLSAHLLDTDPQVTGLPP